MNCNVFRDLLPVYLEGLCSSETGKLMEEHAAQCEECRKQIEGPICCVPPPTWKTPQSSWLWPASAIVVFWE